MTVDDLFETRELTQTVNALNRPSCWLTKRFFKNVKEPTAENIDIMVMKGKRRMSPFVSPKVAGKVVESLGKKISTYKPAYVKDLRIFTPDTVLPAGTVFYADKSNPMQRLAKKIVEEQQDQIQMLDRRIEWMVAQALFTGKINVKGEGVDDVVDFLMDADNIVTLAGTALWSDEGSDPRANLKEWRDQIQKKTGLSPDTVVMGSDAINSYVNHALVKNTLDTRRMDIGLIDPQHLDESVIYYGYDKEVGIDIFSYNDWYYDEDTDEDAPFVPANAVLMGSSKAKTVLAHGLIMDLEVMFATKLFSKSWTEKNPSQRLLLTQSAPLPVPSQIDAFISAEVL